MVQGIFGGQYPAPGVTVEDEILLAQPEGAADLVDLVHVTVELPQRRLIGLIAEPRPELVVVVVLDPRRRKVAVAGFEVLVSGPRPAVQQQHLESGVVAGPFRPDPVPTFRGLHPYPSRSSAQDVIKAGVVQIGSNR